MPSPANSDSSARSKSSAATANQSRQLDGGPSSLCRQFGLSNAEIAARRHLLGLQQVDTGDLAHIQAAITDSIENIVEKFYGHLFVIDTLRRFVGDDLSVERLKRSMKRYLLSLGVEIDAPAYIDDRLRIGVVHERIGLPQYWYMSSMSLLYESIAEELHKRHGGTREQLLERCLLLHRLLSFDSTLVVDAYTEAAQKRLRGLLDQLRVAHAQLETTSRLDGLTGIAHRRALMEDLDAAIEQSASSGSGFALVLLDVDHFKHVNDTWGHKAGDLALISLVSTLSRSIRSGDVIGRFGGEEFAIGLPGISAEEALDIAERIRLGVLASRIDLPKGVQIAVTVSLGVAWCVGPEDGVDEILERADRALLEAKRSGRNRTCLAHKESEAATQSGGEFDDALLGAAEDLECFCQTFMRALGELWTGQFDAEEASRARDETHASVCSHIARLRQDVGRTAGQSENEGCVSSAAQQTGAASNHGQC